MRPVRWQQSHRFITRMIPIMMKYIPQLLDRLANVKGLPVLVSLIVVIISFIAQFTPYLEFLTVGQWLLHVGVIIGLGGMLFSDTL